MDLSLTHRISRARDWFMAGSLHMQELWDLIAAYAQELEGPCMFTLEGHSSFVTVLAVLPDGKQASGSDDNMIRDSHVDGLG